MFLKTEKLYLRALESSDLEFLYNLENDVSIWQVSNTSTPFSKSVLKQYLDQAGLDIYTTRQLRLVICTSGHEQAGTIDLYDFDPMHQRAGIGIVINKPHQRKYLAFQALGLLLNYCESHLLLHQVYCSIAADNDASIKLFNKSGFITVGKRLDWLRTDTGWLDIVEMQKLF